MPWNWSPRIDRVGKPSEASSTEPWPSQKAATLKRLLTHNKGRFDATNMDQIQRHVYLTEQAKSIQDEVEADMLTGFKAWLQGTHKDNQNPHMYLNGDDKPVRRNIDGTEYDPTVKPFYPTHWGKSQLTHLPGVRPWLRHSAVEADKADLELQILAEHGPHDLESAWAYYKHWVCGRPVSFTSDKTLDGGLHDVNPRRATHFDAPPRKDKPGSSFAPSPSFTTPAPQNFGGGRVGGLPSMPGTSMQTPSTNRFGSGSTVRLDGSQRSQRYDENGQPASPQAVYNPPVFLVSPNGDLRPNPTPANPTPQTQRDFNFRPNRKQTVRYTPGS